MDGRSDYGPFITAGIPSGGLFSGAEPIKTAEEAQIFGGVAGEAFDRCYHKACDTVSNVNTIGLDQMADGAAHATAVYAYAKSGRGRARPTPTATVRRKRQNEAARKEAPTRAENWRARRSFAGAWTTSHGS
jgi:Zn-dependent M28 family amino/carboxypeptidase